LTLLSGQISISDKVCYDLDTAKQIASQLIDGNTCIELLDVAENQINTLQMVNIHINEQLDNVDAKYRLTRKQLKECDKVRELNLNAYENSIKRTKRTTLILKGLIVLTGSFAVYQTVK